MRGLRRNTCTCSSTWVGHHGCWFYNHGSAGTRLDTLGLPRRAGERSIVPMRLHNAPGPLTAIILAGGKSTRFGADKASAIVAGKPMLQWVVGALGEVCSELIIVTRQGQSLPWLESSVPRRVATDEAPGLGPLGGLVTGLGLARTELCFATSCDAPLLKPGLVRELASLAGDYDVVCPEVGGRAQPLVAVYRTATCLPAFRHQVRMGALKLVEAVGNVRVRKVPADELRAEDPALDSFVNANHPGIVGEIESRLRSRAV